MTGMVELADELLEVQRLGGLGHVLGGHDRALDDEHVELGLEDVAGRRPSVRWGVTETQEVTPASLISRMRCADQLGLDRLLVDLLHPGRGLLDVELGDLVEQRVGVLVAGPEALEVEHADATEAPDLDGGGRADHAVHGRGHERELEAVGVDLPADVDVLGVPGPPARHDGDVVEPVGPTSRLPEPDLDLCHVSSPAFGGGRKPRSLVTHRRVTGGWASGRRAGAGSAWPGWRSSRTRPSGRCPGRP